ncbi:hypothetical protein [Haloarcula salinisoli]|uniref:Uncharacterized protein n=1 Tax=Haloarcula salinisoli TaxID=2487746 RepID=A0A8J7YLA6_9EURY|nr:hypothetical protein [Halomicroarcula salinisoli]MBX0305289.1 hypothetical protein [Halomicroarcula salinisoli]
MVGVPLRLNDIENIIREDRPGLAFISAAVYAFFAVENPSIDNTVRALKIFGYNPPSIGVIDPQSGFLLLSILTTATGTIGYVSKDVYFVEYEPGEFERAKKITYSLSVSLRLLLIFAAFGLIFSHSIVGTTDLSYPFAGLVILQTIAVFAYSRQLGVMAFIAAILGLLFLSAALIEWLLGNFSFPIAVILLAIFLLLYIRDR